MKYFYFQLKEINGEYQYRHKLITELPDDVDPTKALNEAYAGSWYGNNSEAEGNGFYYNGGEVYVELTFIQEITKEEYDILNKYI